MFGGATLQYLLAKEIKIDHYVRNVAGGRKEILGVEALGNETLGNETLGMENLRNETFNLADRIQ